MATDKYLHQKYLILILCLFMFTMWGINLFSLSTIEELQKEPEPVKPATTRNVTKLSRRVRINPFLYFFAQELQFRPNLVSSVPAGGDGLLVITDPAAGLDQNGVRRVEKWVAAGGSLVVFAPTTHALIKFFDAGVQSGPSAIPETLVLQFPWLKDVNRVSGTFNLLERQSGGSALPLFEASGGDGQGLATARGPARIFLLSNPDFLNPKGLARADNAVFVARLFERLLVGSKPNYSPNRLPGLYFLDPYPDTFVSLQGERSGGATPVPADNAQKPHRYLSLWSIVLANPISWMLVQMAFALTLFFHTLGKRLGRPVKEKKTGDVSTSLIEGLGRLLDHRHNYSFLSRKLLDSFFHDARRKFSMGHDANNEQIMARINILRPESFRQLEPHLETLHHSADGRPVPLVAVLSAVRILEQSRKDLNIHG